MKRTFTAFLIISTTLWFSPLPLSADITGRVNFSRDSDDAEIYGVYAGYRHSFEDSPANPEAGFSVGQLVLTDPIGRERFRVLKLSYSSDPTDRFHLELEGSLLRGDWSPGLYSANASFNPERWYIELYCERGIVDSVTSVQLEYLIDTCGFSIDYAATKEITVVGALFNQNISDGNDRTGKVARIVYTPRKHDWLNLQLKGRIVDSRFDGIGYFSPEKLSEYFFLIGAARPFAGNNWIFRGLAGPGVQYIDHHGGGGERKPATLLEARLKGWFTQQFGLDGRLGYTTSQKTGGSDRYVYGEVNLVYAW